jgi:hypothetical protein
LLGLIAAGVVELIGRGHNDADLSIWAGAAAGVVCIALHSGFDFLWHIPAVLIVAALLVGLAGPVAPGALPHEPNNQEEL